MLSPLPTTVYHLRRNVTTSYDMATPYTTALATENDPHPPWSSPLGVCVVPDGVLKQSDKKKNDSLLAFSLDTHTLNLSLQLHINCPSFETSVQLKQIKNQESCDCYLASMTFLRGNDARFYVWSLCQEMIKLPE